MAPYDDVHKTLSHDCPSLLIPIINEAFHENYMGNEKIIFLHFEYDSQIALDAAVVEEDQLVVDFPRSAVLFLRHTKNTPNKMNITIRTSGGNVSYSIPVIKIQNYTLQVILEKKLLFLVPFYIFRYEKNFKLYEENPIKLQVLKSEYLYIREALDKLSQEGQLTEYEKRTLMEMSQKIVTSLAKNYQKIRKGVDDIMGGKILEYEAKNILQRGIREGKIIGEHEGKTKGRIEMCVELVKKGILSLTDAAQCLNMNEDELKTYLQ